MLTYISNSAHYKEVLSRVQSVKHLLWIGAADIKDLYVEVGNDKKPFLALIAQLIRHGVVRLIYAKEPKQNGDSTHSETASNCIITIRKQ